jgi:hypothetical protein
MTCGTDEYGSAGPIGFDVVCDGKLVRTWKARAFDSSRCAYVEPSPSSRS